MSSESTGEEKEGEREGGPPGKKGKRGMMVQFVAVTLAGTTMELPRSLLRVTLEGHPPPLTSAPNRGRTTARVQGIAVTKFSGLLSYQPSCLLCSLSMRCALERSMVASRLHRSSPCNWARMPSLSFRKGRLCGSTARADPRRLAASHGFLFLLLAVHKANLHGAFLGWRPRLSPLVR
jgi:hypothetical protein